MFYCASPEENEPFVWSDTSTWCRWRSPSLKQHVYSSWHNVSLWYQREVKRIRVKTLQRRLTFNTLQWQRCQSAMQMSLITIGWPVTQLTYQTPWKPSPWWDLSSMVTKGEADKRGINTDRGRLFNTDGSLSCCSAQRHINRHNDWLTDWGGISHADSRLLPDDTDWSLTVCHRWHRINSSLRYHPSSLFPWSSASAGERSRFTQLLSPGEAPPPLSRWSCSHNLNIWRMMSSQRGRRGWRRKTLSPPEKENVFPRPLPVPL